MRGRLVKDAESCQPLKTRMQGRANTCCVVCSGIRTSKHSCVPEAARVSARLCVCVCVCRDVRRERLHAAAPATTKSEGGVNAAACDYRLVQECRGVRMCEERAIHA